MTEPAPVRSTNQRPDERVVVVVVVHEPERDRAAERSGCDTPDSVPGLATPASVPPYTVRSRATEPADVPNAPMKVSVSPLVTGTGNGTVMKTRPVVVVVVVGRIAAAARSAAGSVAVGSAVA